MKCEHNNCTRTATTKNQEYHPDKWLCTYHGNKVKEEGRRKGKMVRRRWEEEDVFKGKIDYIRSWKRCLTQQEIALEYTKRLDLDIITKTKKMNFKEHEIKRAKELRAKFGDLATEVCNEMLDDRVVPNIGGCESEDLREQWRTSWENIKSILNQNKDK